MGLDMWFKPDMTRILAAQDAATDELEKAGADPAYVEGRRAYSHAMHAAFGLDAKPQPGGAVYDAPPESWRRG